MGARGGSDPFLDQASRLVASGAGLTRVTILATRPDSTVVVQADYGTRAEQAPVHSQLPAPAGIASDAPPTVAANSSLQIYPRVTGSYRNPVDLYVRTQRGLDRPTPKLLDLLA